MIVYQQHVSISVAHILKQIRAKILKSHLKSSIKVRNISVSAVVRKKMTDNNEIRQSRFVKEEEISCGKWLSLSQITYTDPTGKERTWEAVSRTTSQTGSDAVCVIAILKRMLKYDCLVLVKQYRPPMKCYTLEFPAGLIDPDETAATCGLRELKEETGYIGTLKHESPVTCLDPGIGGTTCHLITAEIDGDIDSNIHPKNKLEESEFIEVLCIPTDELLNKLNDFTKQGVVVNTMVYSYAIAMEQSKKTKNKSL
ncbi:ADP-sugar pyrophosphatase-like isoform X1 [Mytilus galloprovincialis]|uniref:ADP-sugar pyrophosphatase-like isoform X1 n=1 Tax=Mytilus galloprovincialis TaxID=29158 RepID=UPI003F7B8269